MAICLSGCVTGAVRMKILLTKMWSFFKPEIIVSFLPFLLGVFLMSYPFHAARVVIGVFGGFMLIDGASDIARNIVTKRKANI